MNFYIGSDIIIYNAVGVVYTPWQMDVDVNALLNGWALFISTLFWKSANFMAVSYKRLWKLLIDKDMKKKDLCAKAGINSTSVTKMSKNGHVTTEILLKICTVLDCQIKDILEFIPEVDNNQ